MGLLEKTAVIGVIVAVLVSGDAEGQIVSAPGTFGGATMSFEVWCEQTQRYAADRCRARRPEDMKAYEDYRAVIERYDLQYGKEKEKERDATKYRDRDIFETMRAPPSGAR